MLTKVPGRALALSAMVLLTLPGGAAAQGSCETTSSLWTYIRDCSESLLGADPGDLGQALHAAFEDIKSPQTLNSALGEFEELTGADFLGDLDLHFKSVGTDADNQGLGLAYDWTKTFARTPHQQGRTHFGYSVDLEASGTVTTSAAENPEDFLYATVHPHVYLQSGGAIDPDVVQSHLTALADSIDEYEERPFGESPELSALMAPLWDSLSTQAFLTAGADLRAETTQDFDHRQYAAGVRLGAEAKAWNPNSTAAKLNVFDYPAAALRLLSGADASFKPNGAAFPTMLAALHVVRPDQHPSREAVLGDLQPYPRFSLEVEYRSSLLATTQGTLWLHAMYRYHRELDPSNEVVDAGLHSFSRFIIAIEGPGGMRASWATGHPSPLEADQNDSWGLGFKFRL